jgi:hypothetical protein
MPLDLDNRKHMASMNGSVMVPAVNGTNLTTKTSSSTSLSSTNARQLSTKTVNLKNSNFISNNPFLSMNTNWMSNGTSNTHIFNTITISNKSKFKKNH